MTLLALLAVAPVLVMAQEAPLLPAAMDETAPTIEGSVVSAGNTSLVIAADDGTTRTFVMDTATSLPIAEIVAGDRVTVRYKALDGDRAQALSVSTGASTSAAPGSVPPGSGVPAAEAPADNGIIGSVSPMVLGLGSLAILAFVLWIVTRRGREEMIHISQ
jgi:hypothetical protein